MTTHDDPTTPQPPVVRHLRVDVEVNNDQAIAIIRSMRWLTAQAEQAQAQLGEVQERCNGLLKEAREARARAARLEAKLEAAERALAAAVSLLEKNGCGCDCGHDSEGHDDECDRCLACRIEKALAAWCAAKDGGR